MKDWMRPFLGGFAATALLLAGGASPPAAGQEYGAGIGFGETAVYELGGAVPIKAFQGFTGRTVEARLRFGWTGDLQCGSFDIASSITDQLGSAESAARQMMGNIVDSAQGVVASLPGLVLQRLNPSLYDMLTGMMAEAGIGFRMARANCERTVEAMRGRTAAGGWRTLADGEFWKRQLGAEAEPTAAARAAAANGGGEAGVTWIGGVAAGGAGQAPIRPVTDTARAGFAGLQGRDSSTVAGGAVLDCTDPAERLCALFADSAAAAAFVRDVVGDVAVTTCSESASGCVPVAAEPGEGLRPALVAEIEALYGDGETLGPVLAAVMGEADLDQDLLDAMRGAGGHGVDPTVLAAIREDPSPSRRRALAGRLAAEIAVERTMERAFVARRLLRAGLRDPAVAQNEPARAAVRDALDELNREIDELDQEMRFGESRARNLPLSVLDRTAGRTAAGVPSFTLPQAQPTRGAVGTDADAEREAADGG
ncbi:MAG: integrating conjugative element protein [Acidobacteria bacterium]|nr:integrating conjugative element protein [Acidobacteriota bacterium]